MKRFAYSLPFLLLSTLACSLGAAGIAAPSPTSKPQPPTSNSLPDGRYRMFMTAGFADGQEHQALVSATTP